MESHQLLSSEQYSYITSQTEISNPSEQKKRISKKIDQAFKTFEIILKSKNLPQNFINEVFESDKIRLFLDRLMRYDGEDSFAEDDNKQTIAREMIRSGFSYFQSKYEKTNYLSSEIEKINNLLTEIDSFSQTEKYHSEIMEMYTARSRAITPPIIVPSKDHWNAVCIFCFAYALGVNKTEKEAIKNISHRKGCMCPKDVKKSSSRNKDKEILRYIKIIPPLDSKK